LMVVGEKQALDPAHKSAISSARGAPSTNVKNAAAAPEPGASRAPPRALTGDEQMGVWVLRRGRARCWETREGVGGESARTSRMTVCTVLYVHTCEIPTLPRSAAGLAHGHPDSNRRLRACCRPLPYIITPPRPSVKAPVGQSGRVVGGER